MDSDLHHQYNNQQQQPGQSGQSGQSTMNSGLTRYRSAPSSYFSSLINSGVYGDDDDSDPFFNPRVSSNESDQILSGYSLSSSDPNLMNQIGGFENRLIDSIKQEQDGIYSVSQQQQQQQQQVVYQDQNQFGSHSGHTTRPGPGPGSESVNLTSNLVRQSSSPAGFFSHLDLDSGYPLMRSMDDFRTGASGNIMKSETDFSSGSHLSSGLLPGIPENEAKVMEMKGDVNDGGFGSTSWDDSNILSDSFLKEFGESDQNKLSSINSSQYLNNDVGRIRAPTSLVHHMSLPASTTELDKLMQFQDSVPLRSRAKRGCATHPRSIAERVRRTRISERMRKLQDLVPNMDKQTNTADMLDLAVEYIKELQKEAETLTEHHAKCTCPHKQKL
ncbi:putative transcription factor bHLH family [Helianthus debilis subsp. tardiflorus]